MVVWRAAPGDVAVAYQVAMHLNEREATRGSSLTRNGDGVIVAAAAAVHPQQHERVESLETLVIALRGAINHVAREPSFPV